MSLVSRISDGIGGLRGKRALIESASFETFAMFHPKILADSSDLSTPQVLLLAGFPTLRVTPKIVQLPISKIFEATKEIRIPGKSETGRTKNQEDVQETCRKRC